MDESTDAQYLSKAQNRVSSSKFLAKFPDSLGFYPILTNSYLFYIISPSLHISPCHVAINCAYD